MVQVCGHGYIMYKTTIYFLSFLYLPRSNTKSLKSADVRACPTSGGKMPSEIKRRNKINVCIFADLIEDKEVLTEDQAIHICVRKGVSNGREAAY